MPNAIDYSDKIWWMPKFSSGPKGGGGGGGGQGLMNLLKMASYASMGAEAGAADLATETAKVDALNKVVEAKGSTSAPVPRPEPKQTGWLQNAARGYRISMEPEMKAQQLQVQGIELKNKIAGLALDSTLADQKTFSALTDEILINPNLLDDPAVVSRFQTPQFQGMAMRMVEANNRSNAAKTELADKTRFRKRLDSLDQEDRSAIEGMTPNPNGTPSPMQLEAVGAAEKRKAEALEAKRIAAMEAATARGDTPFSTTITDKETGVTQTFRPVPGSAQSFKPEAPIDYPNGAKLIHVSPQRWQYIAPGGVSKEMSADQLRAIAKDLMAKDENDPVAAQIMQKLSDEAAKQIGTKAAPSTSTATPQRVLKYNPSTGKIE